MVLKKISQDKKENNKIDYSLDIYHLTKSFNKKTLKKGGYTTLKSLLLNPFKREKISSGELIHVIEDLTIRIPKGKSVGIIGRNGAGKSTLLKLIAGIYKPTKGTIKVNGRIAALIELGAGFHPDFTGRENIYLGGAMHGLTRKEIDLVFDDIVEFSELEDFIDAPIRTYSSGMFMRLGFSLAIHTNPEILIVDEVLAVGDASFNAKCRDKLFEIRKQNKTLLLVSHDLNAVQEWCDEVIWIEKGEVRERGEPKRVIDAYTSFINDKDSQRIKEKIEEKKQQEERSEKKEDSEKNLDNQDENKNNQFSRWGSREVEIESVKLLNAEGKESYVYNTNDSFSIEVCYVAHEKIKAPIFGISINRSDGLVINGTNTDIENIEVLLKDKGKVVYKIKKLPLLPAKYFIDVAVHAKDGYSYDYQKNVLNFLVRINTNQVGIILPEHEWKFM